MENNPKISIIIHIEGINSQYFRSFLESVAESTYKNFELVITDSGTGKSGEIASEFFPEKGAVIHIPVKGNRSRGYSLNYGISMAKGEVLLFFDGHSRLNPTALFEIAKAAGNGAGLIYSDNDEILGTSRINPDFKGGANVELIRHRNYIGDIFAATRELLKEIGTYRDNLSYGAGYDLLLRAFEKTKNITHIPKLLYSKRLLTGSHNNPGERHILDLAYREHLTVASAHLKRLGIDGDVKSTKRFSHWDISYDGRDYRANRRDYFVIKDKGVRIRLRSAIPKLYGILKQPDVGIVGGAVLSNAFSYDNLGYIFDNTGKIYPACHGQSVFYDGYNLRCILPQDVAMVDFGFCLIKRRVFKGLNGFDNSLSGYELMLDFCIRAKRAGYRTVVNPKVRYKKRRIFNEADTAVNEALMEKWQEYIERGDLYYNKNLPMGTQNYFLY